VALRQAYGGVKPPKERAAKARPVIGDDPIFWKEVFVDGSGKRGILSRFLGVAVIGIVFVIPVMIFVYVFGDLIPVIRDQFGWYGRGREFPDRWKEFADAIGVWVRIATGTLTALALMGAAVRGAGAVTGERDRDTWVSLMSTPLGAWEMLVGKWWGAVLAPRRLYAVLLIVWSIGLAVGAFEPIMVPVMVLATAVYVSAFAWLGVFCSTTAKTSLGATVRAILAGVFFGGGFWLALVFCCVIPLNILGMRGGLGEFDEVLFLLLGSTPPFVAWWLPLDGFSQRDMEPFSYGYRRGTLSVLAPVIGLMIWAGLAALFAWLAWVWFRDLANREPPAPGSPPIRRAIPVAQKLDGESDGRPQPLGK
ncbi:MAG: ABC transporter permease subunit, partial [Fimbriiglobus sp.]